MLFHFFYDFTISFFVHFLSSWNSCYATYKLHFFWIQQTWNSFFLSSFLWRANWSKRNKKKNKNKKKSKRRICQKSAAKFYLREILTSGLIPFKCAHELEKWRTDLKFPCNLGEISSKNLITRNVTKAENFSWQFLLWFSGGAELLFNKVKEHEVLLPKDENPCE